MHEVPTMSSYPLPGIDLDKIAAQMDFVLLPRQREIALEFTRWVPPLAEQEIPARGEN